MEMTLLDILLDALPEEYVDCVVNNLDDKSVLEEDGYSIQSELMSLFDWHQSREGYDFWAQVYQYVIGESELPPLPIEIKYKPSTIIIASNHLFMMNAADTGINIKYDIVMKDLRKANKEMTEKVLLWLN